MTGARCDCDQAYGTHHHAFGGTYLCQASRGHCENCLTVELTKVVEALYATEAAGLRAAAALQALGRSDADPE